MKHIELTRLKYTEEGVPGILKVDNHYFYTFELPYIGNQPNESSVPLGAYIAEKVLSPSRGYKVFQLKDVPGRTYIQIHIGNTARDIKGCILIGLKGAPDHVSHSTKAFDEFMNIVGDEDIILTIK